jgi:hypothetical protein
VVATQWNDPGEVKALSYEIGEQLRSGRYKPDTDPAAKLYIPGQGPRDAPEPLGLSFRELLVHCVIAAVLAPVRRGQKRLPRPDTQYVALARALSESDRREYPAWIATTIPKFSSQVPLRLVLKLSAVRNLPGDVQELVRSLVFNAHLEGLPWASPLTDLLLNAFLGEVLDVRWHERNSTGYLVRTLDQLLVMGPGDRSVRRAHHKMVYYLRQAGIHVKPDCQPRVMEWKKDQPFQWLNYSMVGSFRRPRFLIEQRRWDQFDEQLARCHQADFPSIQAQRTLATWFDDLGPYHTSNHLEKVVKRALGLARSYGFDELMSESDVHAVWLRSYQRWSKTRSRFKKSQGVARAG